MTGAKLEPAVGRLLVTANGEMWRIKAVHEDRSLDLIGLRFGDLLYKTWFMPGRGEWIARDVETVKVWARLTGVELA